MAQNNRVPEHGPVEYRTRCGIGAGDHPARSERSGWLRAGLASPGHGADPTLVVRRAMVVVRRGGVCVVGGFEPAEGGSRIMSTVEKELRVRNLRLLGLLGGLFLAPLGLAFWMYYATDWRPIRTVNHGELISPVRPLPALHLQPAVPGEAVPADLFHHKWSLVYIG